MRLKKLSGLAVRGLSPRLSSLLVIAATLLTVISVVGGLIMVGSAIATIESSSSLSASGNFFLGAGGTYA